MSQIKLVLFSGLLCVYDFGMFTHFMLIVLITHSQNVQAEQELDMFSN